MAIQIGTESNSTAGAVASPRRGFADLAAGGFIRWRPGQQAEME